ncbi:MAG: hypothetical protein V5804_03340 [Mucilaginibacter sp.]|uniref:hypothetical protein n=1 Tax=Mucilaginibacter sp. TaxID=1882438 RepID=UPI0034E3C9AA
MALIPPVDAKHPKSRIKRVHNVLYDGTKPGNLEFSIAELELHSGKIVKGIRYDRSWWSVNPEKGYPLVQGGLPSWFILPDNFQFIIPKDSQISI